METEKNSWEYCILAPKKGEDDSLEVRTCINGGAQSNNNLRTVKKGDIGSLGSVLSSLGREGWEMVGCWEGCFYFKRKVS